MSPGALSGKALDGWADALGVGNDEDAEQWLAARVGRLCDAMTAVESLGQGLADVPDDRVCIRGLQVAAASIRNVIDVLDDTRQAFARHDRGAST